ncbi:MAG: trans-sialidase [uncultured bacterium]|nr:MAG: trans-sialidase [uncultured bacterium]
MSVNGVKTDKVNVHCKHNHQHKHIDKKSSTDEKGSIFNKARHEDHEHEHHHRVKDKSTTEIKPAETASVEPKAVETIAAEPKTVEAKLIETTVAEVKPAETVAKADVSETEDKPAETTTEAKSIVATPAESNPFETTSVETIVIEDKPAETVAKADVSETENATTVEKAAETKPVETKPVADIPAESKPTEIITKTIVNETEDKIITGKITAEIKPTETTAKTVVTETIKEPAPVHQVAPTPTYQAPAYQPVQPAPQVTGFNNMFSQLGIGSDGFLNFMGFGAGSFGGGMPTSYAAPAYNTAMPSYAAAPTFNSGMTAFNSGLAYRGDATATFGNPTSNIFNLGQINTPISLDNNQLLTNTYGQVDQFIGMINGGMFPNQQTAYNNPYAAQAPGYYPQQQYYPQQAQMVAPQGTATGGMDLGSMMGMLQQMLTYFQQAPAK